MRQLYKNTELMAGHVHHPEVVYPLVGPACWQLKRRAVFLVGCIFFFLFAFSKPGGSIATSSSDKFVTALTWGDGPLDDSGSHQMIPLSATAVHDLSRSSPQPCKVRSTAPISEVYKLRLREGMPLFRIPELVIGLKASLCVGKLLVIPNYVITIVSFPG